MKCPLHTWFLEGDNGDEIPAYGECLKKECSWWSSELDQCDPTGLLPFVKNIASFLGIIADRMPHEETKE